MVDNVVTKLVVVSVNSEEFNKITQARIIVSLITQLGLRNIVLKMLRGY